MSRPMPPAVSSLAAALREGRLPKSDWVGAARVVDAARTPLRVSVVGPPGIGKTGLVNVVAGRPVVPPEPDLGVLHLVHGHAERATLTLRDGAEVVAANARALTEMARRRPAMTRLEAPLRALTRVSLTELTLPEDARARRRALRWMAARTDMVLWCTASFGHDERSAWDAMPETLKDTALLVRTKADSLGSRAQSTLDLLVRRAGEGFAGVHLVSARDAAAARSDRGIDRIRFKAAGGSGLISAILTELDRRDAGFVARAEVVLARHDLAGDVRSDRRAPPPEPPEPPVADAGAMPRPASPAIRPPLPDAVPGGMPLLPSELVGGMPNLPDAVLRPAASSSGSATTAAPKGPAAEGKEAEVEEKRERNALLRFFNADGLSFRRD